MKKIVKISTGSAILTAIVVLCLIGAGFGRSTTEKGIANLNGSWHQTSQDNTPVNMIADIENNHIQIMMSGNSVDLLYWSGTFDTYNRTGSFHVISTATEAALSQATSKTFVYKDGELSYDFTMLGKNYTIHMARGE